MICQKSTLKFLVETKIIQPKSKAKKKINEDTFTPVGGLKMLTCYEVIKRSVLSNLILFLHALCWVLSLLQRQN